MTLLRRLFPGRASSAGHRTDPIVIGGTGGSGTRVVHGILQAAGVYMGWRLNHAGDAMDMEPPLDQWLDSILTCTGSVDFSPGDLPSDLLRNARGALGRAIATYTGEVPDRCAFWGWKNPRSIFVWPLLAEMVPGLKIVHLIRDGRDMALSGNQNQLRKHGAALLRDGTDAITPERSIALWAAVNGGAADWAANRLDGRYLRVRFEDLCANPIRGAAEILHFAGLPRAEADERAPEAAFRVDSPGSLGRWRTLPDATKIELAAAARPALQRFGYSD